MKKMSGVMKTIFNFFGADLNGLIDHVLVVANDHNLTGSERAQLMFYTGYLTCKAFPEELEISDSALIEAAKRSNIEDVQELLNLPDNVIFAAGMEKAFDEPLPDIKA